MNKPNKIKKNLLFISIINFIIGFFSYPYLAVTITSILGLRNGSAYQIQEPERSMDILMGIALLLFYLLIGVFIQHKLFTYSRMNKKVYLLFFGCIYTVGIVLSYCYLELWIAYS